MMEAVKAGVLPMPGARAGVREGKQLLAGAAGFSEALESDTAKGRPASRASREEGGEGEWRLSGLLKRAPVSWPGRGEVGEGPGGAGKEVGTGEMLDAVGIEALPQEAEEAGTAGAGYAGISPPAVAPQRQGAVEIEPAMVSARVAGNEGERGARAAATQAAASDDEESVPPLAKREAFRPLGAGAMPAEGSVSQPSSGREVGGGRGAHMPSGTARSEDSSFRPRPQPVIAASSDNGNSGRDSLPLRVLGVQSVPAFVQPVPAGANPTSTALISELQANPGFAAAAAEAARAIAISGGRGTGIVHMLKVQLHPAELGAVNIRMSVSGSQLSVELHVESGEARQRLNADGDAITRALRALGYEIDRVVVQQSQSSIGSASGGGAGTREGGLNGGAGEGQTGGERNAGAGREEGGSGRHGAGQAAEERRDAGSGGGIYI